MSTIDTAAGPIEASDLVLQQTTQEIPVGQLQTTTYLFHGKIVKQDQHLVIKQEALPTMGGEARI